MTDDEKRHWTQAELVAEAERRFGTDPWKWAFQCPNCKDIATAGEFVNAGADQNRIGQECIGRHLGALDGEPTTDSGQSRAVRGCDWAAYGLFAGPWFVTVPDPEREIPSFRLAPAPAASTAAD